MGFSSDEPSGQFSAVARDTMFNVTGVDVKAVDFRGKFVFAAQVGSPQKAVYDLRSGLTLPTGIGMNVFIRGR